MNRNLMAKASANHTRLEARNAVFLRHGFDAAASVSFVLRAASPWRGRGLDVGTGKGRFAVPLARQVSVVTTVDVHADEQDLAKLEALHAGVIERMEFVRADARRLPWPAGVFDAVVSWNVFHHLDDPRRVFREMLRVLKPAGKLVLADFSPSGFRVMDAIHAAEGRRHPHPPGEFPRWHAWLRDEGFAVRHVTEQHQEVLVAQRRHCTPRASLGLNLHNAAHTPAMRNAICT